MNPKASSNEKAVYSSKKKKRFCDHCDRLVSIRTFNAHKRRKTVDNGSNLGELACHDVTHSDSSELDFGFSSDECSQLPEVQIGSPAVQDAYFSEDAGNAEFSCADSSDSSACCEETDEEAELDLANLVTSSEDDSDVNESFQSKNSPTLSSPVIRLIILFLMTWKTIHNLSDSAVGVLFYFLKQLLKILSVMVQCKALKQISDLLPGSLYMARNYLGVSRDDFETFIVCPKCSSCYKPENCVRTLANGRKKGERCSFVEF